MVSFQFKLLQCFRRTIFYSSVFNSDGNSFFLELPAEFRSACSSANLCANYMEVGRKLFLPTWRLENHKLHQQYSSGNSFKFASFNFHFNPFCNMFYLTISKLVTHCIHLNCNYVANCKHLFKFFNSFLFLL